MASTDCKICGRKQQSFCLRYGGRACTACATFFVRSIKRQTVFECQNFNLCLALPSMIGTSCGKCRFQKCIDIGMSYTKSGASLVSSETEDYDTLASKLYKTLLLCVQKPHLLYIYLECHDDKLIREASALSVPDTSYLVIKKWTDILLLSQIAHEAIDYLFHDILCDISLPTLSLEDQKQLIGCQKAASNLLLKDENYAKFQNKEKIKILATFFVSEFQNLFF